MRPKKYYIETGDPTMKKTLAIILCVLTVLSLCACGAAAPRETVKAADQAAPAAAPAPMPTMNADEGFAVSEPSYAEKPAEEAGAQGEQPDSAKADIDPEKIIYCASVTLETTTFDESVNGVKALIEGCGGFVQSSSVNGNNYYNKARGYYYTRTAYLTVRVPSGEFSRIMEALSTLGNIPYSNVYSENITSQYYDLEARLNACKVQEARLLEMMEKAETVSDVIVIEDRLTELRYQIESMQSTLNNWDRSVNYSTIDISVEEVMEYTEEEQIPLTYGQELGQALKRGLRNAGRFFKNLLMNITESLPAILFLVAVIAAIVLLIKKSIKKRRAKKQEQNKTDA